MKQLKELSPHTVLAWVFLLSLLPFAMVKLFPSWLYHIMDVASYLVFHNIAEFFSVMVSLSIFGVAWFTFEQSKNRHALFLGCVFLAVGLMDFMHTLGYAGMPAFITPNSPLKSTQFWIAVRLYSALAFLASGYVLPGSSGRLLSKGILLASAIAVPGIVKERTAELEKKNNELERMNKVFVGRELRMVELKKQINEIESKLKLVSGSQNAE